MEWETFFLFPFLCEENHDSFMGWSPHFGSVASDNPGLQGSAACRSHCLQWALPLPLLGQCPVLASLFTCLQNEGKALGPLVFVRALLNGSAAVWSPLPFSLSVVYAEP